mmetsp:Transcript_25616/g.39318  ORF Transcript_25616/g.39318 Transcript_25616/m.39318 type:complete len:118 (+) Transcript_25616:243-596(+)
MQSAPWIVLRRWAITIVVRLPPLSFIKASRLACTIFSLSLSKADVASSRIRIFGSLTSARAIAILCFCPPLTLPPPRPTLVSNPSARLVMKSNAFAFLAAASTSSLVQFSFPIAMLL